MEHWPQAYWSWPRKRQLLWVLDTARRRAERLGEDREAWVSTACMLRLGLHTASQRAGDLRLQGFEIDTGTMPAPDGRMVWAYRLRAFPAWWEGTK